MLELKCACPGEPPTPAHHLLTCPHSDHYQRRQARNKRKAKQRKLARRSQSPLVSLDAFRRLRFEGKLREVVKPFYDLLPTAPTLKALRRDVQGVILEFARSKKIARAVTVLVKFDARTETVAISYWCDTREVHVYDVYDVINPGSKKIVGMHVAVDGSKRPIMKGDRHIIDPDPDLCDVCDRPVDRNGTRDFAPYCSNVCSIQVDHSQPL